MPKALFSVNGLPDCASLMLDVNAPATAPPANPPSTRHPTLPIPAVPARHTPVTTAPTTTPATVPMISALCLLTHEPAAFNALFAFLPRSLQKSRPDGSDQVNG